MESMARIIQGYLWVLILLPAVAVAQFAAPAPVRVLPADELLQTLGVQATANDVILKIEEIGQDIGSRFMESRGGALLEDIKAKTGVDLVAFISFVWGMVVYLYIQIHAVLVDIATKLGAP